MKTALAKMSPIQKNLLLAVMQRFTTEGPVPTLESLEFVQPAWAVECLHEAGQSLRPEYAAVAEEVIALIEA